MSKKVAERHAELVREIHAHDYRYYVLDDPLIEEAEPMEAEEIRTRQPRLDGLEKCLRDIADTAKELAERAEAGLEKHRRDQYLQQKRKQQLRSILQIYTGVRDTLKKVAGIMQPRDREIVQEEGYLPKERKGKG